MAISDSQTYSCRCPRTQVRKKFGASWRHLSRSVKRGGFNPKLFLRSCGSVAWNAIRPAATQRRFTAAKLHCDLAGRAGYAAGAREFCGGVLGDPLISPDSISPSRATREQQSVRNQNLIDYYKCPEEFAEFKVSGELPDQRGFFQFGSGTVCYGRCQQGKPASHPTGPLSDVSQAVESNQGEVRLPFDLSEVVDNLRRERYMNADGTSRLSRMLESVNHDIYYFLRPWMPVAVRKYLQRISLMGWRGRQFPHWPVDYTVDTVLEKLLMLSLKAKGVSSVPFIWFWPEGAQSCAMMTHDVETPAGIDFCRGLLSRVALLKFNRLFNLFPRSGN